MMELAPICYLDSRKSIQLPSLTENPPVLSSPWPIKYKINVISVRQLEMFGLFDANATALTLVGLIGS